MCLGVTLEETILHHLHNCFIVLLLSNQLKVFHLNNLVFYFYHGNDHIILNRLVVFSKIYVCKSRKSGYLSMTDLETHMNEIKNTEKKLFESNKKKYIKKWQKTRHSSKLNAKEFVFLYK